MLGVSTDYVAFAGKSSVYFRSVSIVESNESTIAHPPDLVFPEDWRKKNCHIECISVSTDGKLIAVADSLHGVNIFERKSGPSEEWALIFTGVSEKRIIKLQFPQDDIDNQYLTFLDKQGDIFAIRISADHQQISKMKKLMGHTSFISDYITRAQSQQIISCDRDEKIRISNFPDGFTIQGFKLGHTEAVISLVLFEQQGYLLSVSYESLILWDSKKAVCGTSTEFLQKWDVKKVLTGIPGEEITSMKGCCNENRMLISFSYRGIKKLSILEIQLPSMKAKPDVVFDMESDLIFMEWKLMKDGQMCLIVFEPLRGSTSLKSWMFSETHPPAKTIHESNDFSEEMIADIEALGETQKPIAIPMRKRQTRFDDNAAAPNIYPTRVKTKSNA